MKKYLFLLIVLFASCTSKIKIKYVYDGDTALTTKGEWIRLAGIDANELAQFYGIDAKNHLKTLIEGRKVVIRRTGKDKYKRTLADIYFNGVWINKEMVLSGNAWSYKKEFIKEQKTAQNKKLGMWQYNGNIKPYLFRKQNKY